MFEWYCLLFSCLLGPQDDSVEIFVIALEVRQQDQGWKGTAQSTTAIKWRVELGVKDMSLSFRAPSPASHTCLPELAWLLVFAWLFLMLRWFGSLLWFLSGHWLTLLLFSWLSFQAHLRGQPARWSARVCWKRSGLIWEFFPLSSDRAGLCPDFHLWLPAESWRDMWVLNVPLTLGF